MSLEGAIKNEETAQIPQGLPSVEILWSPLAEEDAAAAFLAMLKMAAQPNATVEFLRSVVQIVPEPPDEESLKRLVADLDSPEFNVRNEASRNLERFTAALGPRLSMLADLAKTADARKRIREFAAGQKTEPKFPA